MDRKNIAVSLANGEWLYLVPTTTYCRNCDGGGGCMDCVLRHYHEKCVVDCPVCEGSFKVPTYELHPGFTDESVLEANRVERVQFH